MNQDFVLHYERLQQLYECRVQLKRIGTEEAPTTVVIISPTLTSHAVGVTTMIEWIATAVCQQLVLDPGRVLWIEHYPAVRVTYLAELEPEKWDEEERTPESFDLVTFTWSVDPGGRLDAADPDWQRVSREWIELLLQEDLPTDVWQDHE